MAASAVKFLGVFAPTQLPLAVIEGILTVVIVIGLETYAKPELKSIGFLRDTPGKQPPCLHERIFAGQRTANGLAVSWPQYRGDRMGGGTSLSDLFRKKGGDCV